MHLNVLSPQQAELLPLIRRFRRSFYLVDLYYLLTGHHSIERVSAKADELFGGDFSGKLFREQLCYFDDVDYTESVDYLGAPTPDERIRERLIELSTRIV